MKPFTWQDYKEFIEKTVRRKESIFENEIWKVCGFNPEVIFLHREGTSYMMTKLYSSMAEDWIFTDGKPFYKI